MRAARWKKPLEDIAGKAARIRVRQLLRPFADGETIEEDGSLDAALQQRIFEGADADGLCARDRALIRATDEFVLNRAVTDATWAALSSHLHRRQLIEFCFLAAQYDGLAATMNTLGLPMDFAD